MRVFVAFLLYLSGALLLAAVVLPFVQPWLVAAFGDSAEPSRSLYRLAMLLMLLGLPWFLHGQRLLGWRPLGFTLPRRQAWSALAGGLGIGLAMLALLAVALVALGARYFSPEGGVGPGALLGIGLEALVAGLLVAVIEETFFRGMMHSGMRRSLPFWPTALLVSTFYAGLHFVRPAELPAGAELDVPASLQMLWAGIIDVGGIHDSFLALLVAGLLLSMVRERTGNILWCIGIHAGWVTVIKVTKYLTDTSPASLWVGDYDNFTGWLAALWLALLAAAYWRASAGAARGAGRVQLEGISK